MINIKCHQTLMQMNNHLSNLMIVIQILRCIIQENKVNINQLLQIKNQVQAVWKRHSLNLLKYYLIKIQSRYQSKMMKKIKKISKKWLTTKLKIKIKKIKWMNTISRFLKIKIWMTPYKSFISFKTRHMMKLRVKKQWWDSKIKMIWHLKEASW